VKILFLTTPNEEGLSDILYNGLVKSGNKVIDFPRKPFYHCHSSNGKIRVRDEQNSEVIEDFNGTLTLPNGMKSHRKFSTIATDSEDHPVDPLSEDYEFVVVSSLNAQNNELLDLIGSRKKVPIYFLDGRDDPFLLKILERYKLYFKRELYRNNFAVIKKFGALKKLGFSYYDKLRSQAPVSLSYTIFNIFSPQLVKKKILPLNLSINDHTFKKHSGEKEFDFCFISSPNTPYRIKTSKMLEKLASKHNLKVFLNLTEFQNNKTPQVPWNEYVDVTQNSKMAISLPGAGFDTFRYWEIPYYGTCLVSPYLPIEIPNNFEDMNSAIFFSNFSQLEKKLLRTLKNDSWKEIAIEGHKKFKQYHSSEQRAKRFLESL
jgi:hypothetical protein